MNEKNSKFLMTILKSWIPLALTITCFCGITYLVLQQNYRLSANDPQIQIAQDIATQIKNGQSPNYFIPKGKTDISKSLSAFILLFDEKEKLIGSSASINGKELTLPNGVLSKTKLKGQTRFTWEPSPSIRSAVVISYYKSTLQSGYILVGKSLKEVELRIASLGTIVLVGWLVSLLSTFLTTLVLHRNKH